MGRTPKPLDILVDPSLDGPEFDKLRAQGHTVRTGAAGFVEWWEADLILSPRAWYMTPDHKKYLDVALKAARATRYPEKKATKGGKKK